MWGIHDGTAISQLKVWTHLSTWIDLVAVAPLIIESLYVLPADGRAQTALTEERRADSWHMVQTRLRPE